MVTDHITVVVSGGATKILQTTDNTTYHTPAHQLVNQAGTSTLGIFAEDAAHVSGDTGIQILAKRTDAAAVSSGTDGDYSTFNVDASGRLWVNAAAVGTITPGTAATSLGKAEDAAHTSADVGVMMLAKRTDSAAVSSGTDGDYSTVNVDANGLLWCNVGTALPAGTNVIGHVIVDSGTVTTVSTVTTCSTVTAVTALTGGGVSHDGAAGTVKPHLLGAFASAAVPSDVSADGDATQLWCLRSGALCTQPTFGGVPAVAGNGASGTGVQRVTIANDSTGIIALTTGSAVIGSLTSTGGGTAGAAGTAGTKSDLIGGVFTAWASLPAGTTTQQVGAQCDPSGTLKVGSAVLGTPIYTSVDSGGAAAANGTLTIPAAKMGFLDGFDVDGLGATTGASIAVTVVGILGGTLTYRMPITAGATTPNAIFSKRFNPPLQASATNTNIVVNVPSFGSGNTASSNNVYGHYV